MQLAAVDLEHPSTATKKITDRNLRDQAELFKRTAEFCQKYDVAAFMQDYDTLPLSFFEPMVRRVLAQPRLSIYKKAIESTDG